ncbi:nuclease-related domain-containing protein [Streptomyces sp. NPDC048479]|uniref:nuclease-related domain-containing protein n=1 Tax=Streptomyces sp. NPDC048479 TaxID=3154725 RepID=UPI00342DC95C
MTAGQSAAAWAEEARAAARRGLWRRVLTLLGVRAHTRRADAVAARRDHGAEGERATARLLAQLEAQGWHVRHDLALPRSRANLDHVLISPCGTTIVALDTKAWNRSWPTTLIRGRVHCGNQDRHEQVEKVAGYARRVADAVNIPRTAVRPLIVVHGSPVAGGYLEASTPDGPVLVLSPPYLVPTLAGAPGSRDPWRAGGLADRVDAVLLPYQRGG